MNDEILKKIISKYGTDAQIDVAVEEMSELIKALMKWKRNGKSMEDNVEIIDEISDVKIMCRQLELIFHCEEDVNLMINYKLDRQMERMKKN